MVKRKRNKLYVKWKGYDHSSNIWSNEKILNQFFLTKFSHYKWVNTFLNRLKVFERILALKLIFPTLQQKLIKKNVTHVDTSSFALKANLASLKPEVDKLDIDKIAPVPVSLSKLSDVVKMMLLKKLCMINSLQK